MEAPPLLPLHRNSGCLFLRLLLLFPLPLLSFLPFPSPFAASASLALLLLFFSLLSLLFLSFLLLLSLLSSSALVSLLLLPGPPFFFFLCLLFLAPSFLPPLAGPSLLS